MRVVGIIQARMGSTRLPGKVLMPVLDRPLLSFMLERLTRCRAFDAITVATTMAPADAAVAEVATAYGAAVFRGDENDVLDRYYRAAREAEADIVVRLTADCPLIEPAVCDAVVALLNDADSPDYAATSPHFAEGLDCEAMTRDALEQSWRNATLRSEREHVTLYIRNHPEHFSIRLLDNPNDEGGVRVTVDEPDDFKVVATIIEALYPVDPTFGFAAVQEFLATHPEVAAQNATIVRNAGLAKSLHADGLDSMKGSQ